MKFRDEITEVKMSDGFYKEVQKAVKKFGFLEREEGTFTKGVDMIQLVDNEYERSVIIAVQDPLKAKIVKAMAPIAKKFNGKFDGKRDFEFSDKD